MNNHEIDYKIHGDDMQFVEVELDPGETVVAEAGGLMMMEEGITWKPFLGMVQTVVEASWENY